MPPLPSIRPISFPSSLAIANSPRVPERPSAAMVMCTGSYAITQGDIDNGVVVNTADADGQCTAPNCPVNDDDTHMQTIPPPPLEYKDGFENPL